VSDYTDAAAIAAYLATTFTPEQETAATTAAHAITVWIDHRTGRSWQTSGPIAAETHTVEGTIVFLNVPPVVSIERCELYGGVGSGWSTLDPSAYELVDPPSGQVGFLGGYNGAAVRFDYTSDTSSPPADLAYAATVLAADLVSPTLDPDLAGVESIAVGQNDINLKFAATSSAVDGGGATSAVRVVDSYRRVVIA
jgi:hypothetical protein